MSAEQILIIGKVLIWFLIPLGAAFGELWRLRDRKQDSDRAD